MRLQKYAGNPVLKPNRKNGWESAAVCNPGAFADKGKVHLLYRAAGEDKAHRIHFGLAVSGDGFRFRRVSGRPALSPSADGIDGGCIEDARIVKMGGHYFVTYAFRPFPPGRYWEKKGFMPEMPYLREEIFPRFTRENLTMSGLLISKDLRSFIRAGAMTSADVDDRDVILFPEKINGKFVMLHRPVDWVGPKYGCKKPSMWISFADDPLVWREHHLFAQPRFLWEKKKIGGSAPPVRTRAGWLVLYHGVDGANVYRTGVMLLDLKNPRKILARAPDFVLEPEHEYEKKGIMPNVVFPTGNVVLGDKLFVYYGGGDKCIAVATAPLDELLRYVLQHKTS